MDASEENLSAEEERFKTALHYTVGKLSEKAAEDRMERQRFLYAAQPSQCMPAVFTKEFIAALTDITFDMIGHWGKDLEAFAKHAKRTMINADDVRLLCRHSPSLTKLLDQTIDATETIVDPLDESVDSIGEKQTKISKFVAPAARATNSNSNDFDDHDQSFVDLIEDTSVPSPIEYREPQKVQEDDLDDIIMMMDVDEVVGKNKTQEYGCSTSATTSTSAVYSKYEPATKPKSGTVYNSPSATKPKSMAVGPSNPFAIPKPVAINNNPSTKPKSGAVYNSPSATKPKSAVVENPFAIPKPVTVFNNPSTTAPKSGSAFINSPSTKPKSGSVFNNSSTIPKPSVPPAAKPQVDEEGWGDFRMPQLSQLTQVTMESIERRRRSAREKTEDNEFSLAGFDDKWWE